MEPNSGEFNRKIMRGSKKQTDMKYIPSYYPSKNLENKISLNDYGHTGNVTPKTIQENLNGTYNNSQILEMSQANIT